MALFVFPLKSINGSNMYNNDDFRQYFANFISTGILANVPLEGSTAFQVTQTDNPSMNVIVGSGVAWIIGGQVMNTSPLSFQIPAPLTSQSRTDSIVVQWSNSSNNGDIIYKQNSTQVVQTNDVYELQLCKILVPANATNISQANITDMRADTSVCGFSSPYEAIKTGDLLAQFKSELEANGVLFSQWFETIKGQLSEDAAGNLQNQLDLLDSKVYTAYANSADGTEDFTTVYPNLNLEQHTKMLVDKNNNLLWGTKGSATATMTYDTLTIPETSKVIDAVRVTQIEKGQSGWRGPNGAGGSYSVTPGGQVSISTYIKNNSQTTVNISLQVGVSANANQSAPKYLINRVDVPADGIVHLITGVLDVPAGYNYAWSYVYATNGTTSADFTFGQLKVELGAFSTSYMPASSEVTSADYPQYNYVGRMAGLNVADKNDPKNYRWQINTDIVRDQKGTALVKDLEVTGKTTQGISESISFPIGYGASVNARRTGNLVEILFSGQTSTQMAGGTTMNEKIPDGFRPADVTSIDFLSPGKHLDTYYYFNPDGTITYQGETLTAKSFLRGVRTYFTNDPWPVIE
ncbi:hypothetical protein IL308_12930 [Lactococcus lactis]|uniref:hypothetical protein n=1 Tax=Lactococcus lactis TaxID=1358 RepID=UPI001911A5E9|nr:hypothetical protein [Lactococcus lactis]MBK5077647.1 hypothetical protein [Lactococcus lactis]